MAMEELENYKSLFVDYSFIREFGGTAVLSEFLDFVTSNHIDIYVSKSFKLLHYCVLHQADSKTAAAISAMREFCSRLLEDKLLHSVQVTDTVEFLNKASLVSQCCIVMASRGIFINRITERYPVYIGDFCVFGQDGDPEIYHGLTDLISNLPKVEISPLASVNKYLDVPVYCNVGDTVTTEEGVNVVLEKRVSAGAEGMVFTTDNPGIVAKIYHKGIITPMRWKKLQTQVDMGLNSTGVCWPQHLLFYKGIPVGYTMITGKGKTLGNVFDGPEAMLNYFPEWKRLDVVTTLADILEKYIYLHMFGIVAGDIQMKNALIYSSNSIYLIDMDSVQVGNLPCPVGTEEFTDPRLWGTDFSDFLRKLEDEDYSIAMMVFSLLFCGLHPYATRNGAETLREEILEKNFPYTMDNSSDEHIPKGGYNHIWEYLPDNLRQMLYGTFREGKTYEAVTWYDAVLSYKDALSSQSFEDVEAYKIFPKMDYVATDPHPISKPRFTPPAGKNTPGKSAEPVQRSALTPEQRASNPRLNGTGFNYGGNLNVGNKGVQDNLNPPAADPVSNDKGGLFGIFKKKQ